MRKFFRSVLNSDFRLFVVFFIYPAAAALFVQLILLPYIFPQWNAGEGLLKGGDWYGFHLFALSLAQKIQAQGWSAWVLRPHGEAPSGIAAIFYVLISPHPWVLIPLFAGLHAAAALVLFKIIMRLTANRVTSLIAVLPFWLFPSAMIWYTQIHKDGFLIAGAMLVLLAWLRFSDSTTWKHWQDVLISILVLSAGAFLAWVVRPYSVQMMEAVSLIIVLVEIIIFVVFFLKKQWQLGQTLLAIAIVCASLVIMNVFTTGGIEAELPPAVQASAAPDTGSSGSEAGWTLSGFPSLVESKAYALARARTDFALGYPDAGSNIDVTVSFHSLKDILFYVPRATEIAFLAPFPPDWFKPGTLPANTVMRRESGFEMSIVYITLLLLPFAAWHWRRRADFWLILIFCSGMLLIYGLAIANVGTLYRFRYGFLMTIVAADLAAGITLLRQLKSKNKPV